MKKKGIPKQCKNRGASTKIVPLPLMVLLGVLSKDAQMAEREKAAHEARCLQSWSPNLSWR